MKLHALTLSYNGVEKLKKLQLNLIKNFARLNMECLWHVRDNGSKDDTEKVLFDFDFVKLYKIDHNRDSFAKCVNYLFEMAKPADDDLILLLNNDVQFADEVSLLKMNALMNKTGAGVVGARLLYTGTDKLQHAGVGFSNHLYGQMPWHYRRGEKSDTTAEANRYFQAVTAAVCLVKASSFRRAGGMSEELRWAFDDIDLNFKIGQKEKIAYCGETKIFHEESATLKKNNLNKLFMEQNVRYFKEKWWSNNKPKYKLDYELYLKDKSYNEIKD